MKKIPVYQLIVFFCVVVLSACEFGLDTNAAKSTPAVATLEKATTRSTDCGLDCEHWLSDCQTMCIQQYSPDGNQIGMCVQNCINQNYVPCIMQYNQLDIPAQYVFGERGNTICFLDVDRHLFKVTIELYTADRYIDLSCKHYADLWKLRLLASVDCSYWTALTDKNEMAARIEKKIRELTAQGYYPTFTMEDVDTCPLPRYYL